jgi:ABC-type ATPase with predicted acetyltransferase domain
MQLNVHYDFLPKTNTVNASVVMDHFGIDFEQGRHVIAKDLELPLRSGDVVLFNGPSGSGKSSLLRAAADQIGSGNLGPAAGDTPAPFTARTPCQIPQPGAELRSQGVEEPRSQGGCRGMDLDSSVLDIDRLELPQCILADALPLPIEESLSLLSLCGLSEAQLLLRTPAELSDGQRYRFRLAFALAHTPAWLVADEFTAKLDRTLAKVIAYNIRRLAQRTGTGVLLATTHDDVIDDLNPDVFVRCELDGTVHVERRGAKKNESALPSSYGSARGPAATGRTSLGGITGATTSARSAG